MSPRSEAQFIMRSWSPGACGVVVTPKIPADADGVVNPERLLVGAGVERAQALVEGTERIHAVIGNAQLEVLGELNGETHGALEGQRSHRIRVFHLGNVVAKEKIRLEEKIRVFQRRAREGLKFDVASHDVARKSGAGRLRLVAATEVRFVVRRRDFKIAIASQEILSEKQRAGIVVL